MPTYAPKTVGNLEYKLLDRLDGVLFGRINLGTWQPISWLRNGTPSTGNPDHALVRTDVDRKAVDLYWIEDGTSGVRTVTLTRPVPGDGTSIVASRMVTLREGITEV